jgi:hypothetical protein
LHASDDGERHTKGSIVWCGHSEIGDEVWVWELGLVLLATRSGRWTVEYTADDNGLFIESASRHRDDSDNSIKR